jgi:hypothetical protein
MTGFIRLQPLALAKGPALVTPFKMDPPLHYSMPPAYHVLHALKSLSSVFGPENLSSTMATCVARLMLPEPSPVPGTLEVFRNIC